MKIPSDQIPQADNIEDVIETVKCIASGGQTFQDIAKAINKVDRQGRYYRKAAEILGFIETKDRNHSVLTNVGKQFIQNPTIENPLVVEQLFSAKVFQRIIPYLEIHQAKGVTKEEIVSFIMYVSEIKDGEMAPRRFSSVVSWMESLNLIEKIKDRYFLSAINVNEKVELLEFEDDEEPLNPKTTDLKEYETVKLRVEKASEAITIYRNQAAADRADNAHRELVNLVAKRIKLSKAIPRYNQYIDLATKYEDQDFIFEMKSITPDNIKSQIRTGLSQLYEYRYLQNLPNAKLVLVIEKQLTKKNNWMLDYLENDRNVSLVWDGDNELFGSDQTKDLLNFLSLK